VLRHTGGKKLVVVVGQRKALAIGVRNNTLLFSVYRQRHVVDKIRAAATVFRKDHIDHIGRLGLAL
jgi:hypothetical protein